MAQYSDAANLQNNGEFDLAAEQWASFLKNFPDDPLTGRVQYYKGVCHVRLNQFEQAARDLALAIPQAESAEHREQAYLQLGWAQLSHGQSGHSDWLAKAETTLRKCLAEFPDGKLRDQGLFYLGEALYHSDKKKEAAKAYAELVNKQATSPLLPDALYALGVTYQETDQSGPAKDAFHQFLAKVPDHELATEVKMRQGEAYLQSGNAAEAEKLLAEAASNSDFPSADYALLRQAYAVAAQERPADAAGLYEQLRPGLPEVALCP